MRTRFPILLLVLVVSAGLAGCKSTGSDRLSPTAGPAELLAEGNALATAGDHKDAQALFERVVDDHPASAEATEAAWMAAEMSYAREDWRDAMEEFQRFHDAHPLHRLGQLENRMYDIGVNLYRGGGSGLLGAGIFTTYGQSYTALGWIADNLPNGSRADDALLFMGKARLKDYLHEEAVDHFVRLIDNYPESEWILEARFYLGWAYWLTNRGAPYDLKGLVQARQTFSDYVARIEKDPARRSEYSGRLEEARENIQEIEATIAEKNLFIARYYLSVERPESARVYLEAANREFPGTEAGQEAAGLLGEAVRAE